MATRVGGPGGARIKGSCPQETGGSLQTSWQLIKGQRMETSPVQSPAKHTSLCLREDADKDKLDVSTPSDLFQIYCIK